MNYLLKLLILIFIVGCNRQIQIKKIDTNDIEAGSETSATASGKLCRDKLNYAPDANYPEHTPMRYIWTNFHFIGKKDSSYVFNEYLANEFVKLLLEKANKKLANNQAMRLPEGNNTPVLPTRFRYLLAKNDTSSGIYFHYNDTLYACNKKERNGRSHYNLVSNDHYNILGINKGKILNVFILSHPADSLNSPTYKVGTNGAGKSRWVKLVGPYNVYKNHIAAKRAGPIGWTASDYSAFFNHELGHTLGLPHTWGSNDGCGDTPKNPNYWDASFAPDKDINKVSNNVMDYNAWQDAFTPCQLGKVHYNFSRPGAQQRKILKPVWCEYKPMATISIPAGAAVVWSSSKDLEGDIIVKTNANLSINCQLNMPPGGKIIVEPQAQLFLNDCVITNVCDTTWSGIQIMKSKEGVGQVYISEKTQLQNMEYPLGGTYPWQKWKTTATNL